MTCSKSNNALHAYENKVGSKTPLPSYTIAGHVGQLTFLFFLSHPVSLPGSITALLLVFFIYMLIGLGSNESANHCENEKEKTKTRLMPRYVMYLDVLPR
jgi:hypothetical protein